MSIDGNRGPDAAEGQLEKWREFYESAWDFRYNFMRQLVDSGERNPLRIISTMERREERHLHVFHSDTGAIEFTRNDPDPNALGGLLPTGQPAMRYSSLRGKMAVIPYYTTTDIHEFLAQLIEEKGPFDAIVELGCGYGRNLFHLYYKGGPSSIPYYGGELTASGVKAGRMLANLEDDFDVHFEQFDFTKPSLDFIPKFNRIFFFTVHTIEQVQKVYQTLFRIIVGAGKEVVCAHLEPFGFQLEELGEITRKHEQFCLKQGWNVNLFPMLVMARDQGLLALDYVATELFYAADPLNPTSFALWHAPAD